MASMKKKKREKLYENINIKLVTIVRELCRERCMLRKNQSHNHSRVRKHRLKA
jgi:ribosomal protein L29